MRNMIRNLWILVGMLALLVAPALAQDEDAPAEEEAVEAEVVMTREALPSADAFQLETVVGGLDNPLYVTHAGDGSGRLFVLEQSGRIWIVQDDILQNTPFIDLSNIVSQDILFGYSERGLLGIAFHPNYEENGLFYVNYTDQEGTTRIVSYSVSADDPNLADPSSARELLSIGQPYPNHNGGHMDFGPDGYLYISVGDGGLRDDPLNAGQDPATLLGTILRIDVDDFDFDRPYGIPSDNPFTVNPNLALEVWSWGLRNVWRFSFDRATGDLYMGDVGQNQWEEINFQPADSPGGENYGWKAFEANLRYLGPDPVTDVVMPVAYYDHSEGCSITGGYVYRGEAIPELQGAYLYSDYCSGNLWAAYRNTDMEWEFGLVARTGRSVSSFGEDEAGELYLVDYSGSVLRFVPADAQ